MPWFFMPLVEGTSSFREFSVRTTVSLPICPEAMRCSTFSRSAVSSGSPTSSPSATSFSGTNRMLCTPHVSSWEATDSWARRWGVTTQVRARFRNAVDAQGRHKRYAGQRGVVENGLFLRAQLRQFPAEGGGAGHPVQQGGYGSVFCHTCLKAPVEGSLPPFPAMSTVFQGTCVLRSRQGTGRLQKRK